ncbi:hypothetical protein CBW24_14335 [Pacificitalea manganoxidans]|uniref:Uncharacterized protein n=1 Tax=Pacificitalea manganoxidans TaxID=1411902 RepID=A0A291M2W9_9RHOB|nr:hypothetical protein [Pacificitalea manganoxidans]ATI43065.1 hypothetical protein CBW24_14335 [Pacificitalea manganoxidans]MDR6307002.1 hypothetical protein [Pacificitalea manganoxidans]
MATPFEIARDFHRALLERELVRRGEVDAVHYLDDRMRLAERDGTADGQGGGTVRAAVFGAAEGYQVKINAVTGTPTGWYLEALATGGDETTPPDQMIDIARSAAAPPPDALLEIAAYETNADRTVFRARWTHTLGGIPIEGDYIEVLGNGARAKPFALSRHWRNPRPGAPPEER